MDAKLTQICNHVVSGAAYSKNTCPRCMGEGVYYDVSYDVLGRVDQVTGSSKLKQDILKLFKISKNPFHPEYGSLLAQRLNKSYDPNIARTIVCADLRQTVARLKAIQDSAPNLLDSERIRDVISIAAWCDPNEPRRIRGAVVVETQASQRIELSTSISVV